MPIPKKKAKPEPKPVKKATPVKKIAKPLCDHEFQPESGREVLRKKEVGEKELDYLTVSSYTASVCNKCGAARPGSVKESFELPTEDEIKDYYKGKDQKPPMAVLKAARERWEAKEEAAKVEVIAEPASVLETKIELPGTIRPFKPTEQRLAKEWWKSSETFSKLRHGKYYSWRQMLQDLQLEAVEKGGEQYALPALANRFGSAAPKELGYSLNDACALLALVFGSQKVAKAVQPSEALLGMIAHFGGHYSQVQENGEATPRVFVGANTPLSEALLHFLSCDTKDFYFGQWRKETEDLEAANKEEPKAPEVPVHVPGAAAPVQSRPAPVKKEKKPVEWDLRPYPDIAGTIGRFMYLKENFVEHPAMVHHADENNIAHHMHMPAPKKEGDEEDGENRIILPVAVKDSEGKLRARVINYSLGMLIVSVKLDGDLVEVVIRGSKRYQAPKA